MRRVLRVLSVLGILLGITHSAVSAQAAGSASPGNRVRLSIAPEAAPGVKSRTVGTLLVLTGDSIVVRDGSGQVERRAPLSAVERLEISTGRRSRTAKGALIGGLSLGILAAVQSYVEESRCKPSPFSSGLLGNCGSPAGMAAVGFVLGGAVGAGAGALIGSFIRTDRWLAVPLEVSGTVGPGSGGVTITLPAVR